MLRTKPNWTETKTTSVKSKSRSLGSSSDSLAAGLVTSARKEALPQKEPLSGAASNRCTRAGLESQGAQLIALCAQIDRDIFRLESGLETDFDRDRLQSDVMTDLTALESLRRYRLRVKSALEGVGERLNRLRSTLSEAARRRGRKSARTSTQA